MARKRGSEIAVIAGSGNVFADIGLPEPEEELAKAQLASCIRQVIKRQRLTQVPTFVTTRGGGYFFLPGLRSLRYLSNLR